MGKRIDRMLYPDGKSRALTFSYDDGVVQDRRLVAILNQYGMKGTFNLNYGYLGFQGTQEMNGRMVDISKIAKERVEHVEDYLTLGDKVKCKCLGKDKMGRISFSIKDAQ